MRNFSIVLLGVLCGVSSTGYASGFALIEQSASGQGLSYAGAAASTEDASVMWFNPAGIAVLPGSQAVLAAHRIDPSAKFSNNGSYLAVPGNSISGQGDDGATVGVVPNLYWKRAYGPYHVGFGLNVPFGQHISYKEDWVGRYHATETNLKTYQFNPTLSRKLSKTLALGLGLNAQSVNLEMQQKVNQAALTSGAVTADGNATIKADSWGYGYNLGMLFTPNADFKMGIAYRSNIKHSASGTVKYDVHAALSGALKDGGISSDVVMPASAIISLSQKLSQQLTLLGGVTWTKWSDYKELVIQYDSGQADANTRQDFMDVWRYSLGAIYQLNPSWKFRTGVALDRTPVQNATNRSPRTPDSDRNWLSVGVGYQINTYMNVDVGYSHLFAEKSPVNYTTDDKQYLVGDYDASVDIFSAQLVWKY